MSTVRFTIAVRRARPKLAPKPRTAPRRGNRSARMLALAHKVEQLIEDGELRDYAHAARLLGISRPRISQISNLLLLAPDIQARVLSGDTNIHERRIRSALRFVDWEEQRAAIEGQKT